MNACYVVRSFRPAGLFSFGLLDGLPVRLCRPHLREAPAGFGLERLVTAFMNNPGRGPDPVVSLHGHYCWNPSIVTWRFETHSYGPQGCPRYKAGPPYRVPGRGPGMIYVDDDVERAVRGD